ncbi:MULTISPECIES: hypothetical protein [Bradyrhizobium]|uniref:Uncharacterized protein n=2 Tax=Bradyrhizobium TaxID=374 RepID=A0A562RPW1_9BRAD|nr:MULTISPECIES: hypothetical protein [Bradyrhizobium]TWI70430.1 hypothetical protein IQ16_03603 [Bradyrhizobium huanghuaihaiense]UQE03487.1 hypothetical protein JEY30_46840 [Bradyrhizobium japonicum]SFV07126.1 hypothetical protein SAMN05192541_11317 [Bradyrhizobium arachidis]
MSKSKSGVQLDMFPPFTINKTDSGRVIVRPLEDGHGIKNRVDRLCEAFGGRYVDQEEGYVMTKAGVANMEAAYVKGRESFFWLL